MTLLERFLLLMSSPDDATYDLYDSPNIGHAAGIVTVYAFLASFNSFLSVSIKAGSFGFSFIAFLGVFLATYLTWIFLTVVFYFAAELWGSLAEIVNTAAFVGMAAAPLVITSLVSILLTVIGSEFIADDTELILSKISLGISLVGMVWGWPGLLCYYGLKNGSRLHPAKAATITLIAFLAGAVYEITYSNAF